MLIRQSLIYLIGRLLPSLIYFGLIAYYTRVLTPDDYGRYAFGYATVMLLIGLFFQWTVSAALRFGGQADNERQMRWGLVGSWVIAALAAGTLGIVAYPLLEAPEDRALFLSGAALFFASGCFEMNTAFLAARLAAVRYAAFNTLRAVLSALFGALAAHLGLGAPGILGGMALGVAIPAITLSLGQLKGMRLRPAEREGLKQVANYGLPLMLGYTAANINNTTDRYVLAALRGEASLGQYYAGYELADRTIRSLVSPVAAASLPVAIKALSEQGVAAARDQLRKNVLLLAAITVPAGCGLIAVSRELVEVVIGAAFRDTSRAVLPVMALAMTIWALRANYLDHAFQLGLRTGRSVAVFFSGAVVNLGLSIPFVMLFGIEGAAYAVLAAQIVAFAVSYGLGRQAFPMPVPGRELAKILIAGLVMALAVLMLPSTPLIMMLAVKIVFGAGVYGALLLAFDFMGARRLCAARLTRLRPAR